MLMMGEEYNSNKPTKRGWRRSSMMIFWRTEEDDGRLRMMCSREKKKRVATKPLPVVPRQHQMFACLTLCFEKQAQMSTGRIFLLPSCIITVLTFTHAMSLPNSEQWSQVSLASRLTLTVDMTFCWVERFREHFVTATAAVVDVLNHWKWCITPVGPEHSVSIWHDGFFNIAHKGQFLSNPAKLWIRT